jgi:hypothetical protein
VVCVWHAACAVRQVTLDELDVRDLRAVAAPEALQGLVGAADTADGEASGASKRRGVRVATIDNYQARHPARGLGGIAVPTAVRTVPGGVP